MIWKVVISLVVPGGNSSKSLAAWLGNVSQMFYAAKEVQIRFNLNKIHVVDVTKEPETHFQRSKFGSKKL